MVEGARALRRWGRTSSGSSVAELVRRLNAAGRVRPAEGCRVIHSHSGCWAPDPRSSRTRRRRCGSLPGTGTSTSRSCPGAPAMTAN